MKFVQRRLLRQLSPLLVAAICAACATEERKPAAKPGPPDAVAAPAKPAPPPVAKPAPPAPREAEPPAAGPPKGVLELRKGVQSYEDGDYKAAARAFKAALDAGLATGAEQAVAHKHLAFMHCVANRRVSCRNEFRKAFAADPAFDLTPAEAGHPMWAPLFRQVKAEAAKKRK